MYMPDIKGKLMHCTHNKNSFYILQSGAKILTVSQSGKGEQHRGCPMFSPLFATFRVRVVYSLMCSHGINLLYWLYFVYVYVQRNPAYIVTRG